VLGTGGDRECQGAQDDAENASRSEPCARSPQADRVPSDDCRRTGDGHSSDKHGDKPDDKLDSKPNGPLPPDDDALAGVIEAWPRLPEAVRTAILALVRAVTKD
jgi:hypothetical protein